MIVIRTTAIGEIIFSLTPVEFTTTAVSISAKVVAAEAEAKKPASVTPIWIVDKNLLGFFMSFKTCFAFLLPSSACFSIFASLSEIIQFHSLQKMH